MEVFSTVAQTLGDLAPRIPDGETGERLGWIAWTRDHLRKLQALEPIGRRGEPGPRFRLKSQASDIDLGPLQYAPAAILSYAQFRTLKAQGKIPGERGSRFRCQHRSASSSVSFPMPIS